MAAGEANPARPPHDFVWQTSILSALSQAHANSAPDTSPSRDDHATGLLAGAIRVVSGLTLLSRFAGLARDVLTARLFGDGPLGSAFRAAYGLPNFFRRLFGEGALSAAFLPEYALAKRDDPARAKALASVVVTLSLLVTGALTGLIQLVLLLRFMLWPTSSEGSLSLGLTLLMLPMMPAVCITAILSGVLQAHGRFAMPAGAPIVLNVFQIAAGGVFFVAMRTQHTTAAYVVGASALLASWCIVAWAWWSLRGKISFTRSAGLARDSAQRVFRRFVPAALGLGTLQLNTLMDMVIAMWPIWIGATMFGRPVPLDGASNAILSYTQTLYQFPLGVFGIAVATAVFPLLSRSSDKPDEFVQHLRRGLRLSLFIGLPASVGLILVRHDLVAVIFGGGAKAFSSDGLARAAGVLLGFAPAVWAYSLNHVLTRAYYAKGNTTTPMRVAMACVALNLALNFSLIWLFREAGLAWSTATSATVQCLTLALLAPRHLGVRPFDAATWRGLGRIVLVAALMALAVLAATFAWRAAGFGDDLRWWQHLVRLATSVVVGAGVYALLSRLLRLEELRWLLTRAPAGTGKDGAEGMSFE